MIGAHRRGDGRLRAHDALSLFFEALEGGDDPREREEATFCRDQADEIGGDSADPRRGKHRVQRLHLLGRGKHRALHQTAQIRALAQQSLKGGERLRDFSGRVSLGRQLVEGKGVTSRYAGKVDSVLSHLVLLFKIGAALNAPGRAVSAAAEFGAFKRR